MQRLTMIYLATYLLVGGLGLLAAPDVALSLLQSNGAYGDIMPRVVGMFMLVVSGFVVRFLVRSDYSYYAYTVQARTFIVIVLSFLYMRSHDPLFLVLDAIVLVGLLPSAYVLLTKDRTQAT